ncbi:AraC family transcriptional regulator [uncultured Ruegeria sp.]|uniref:AraC family transcriptional regulator n=1 Tax=uncultured Ruegeria sp. TaxID=259304 RepID=UPI00261A1389|nr:AraC family transcriptional regulator [uncultured Ruegeria sp.]
MASVTYAFARAMANAAGMTLNDDGALISNGAVVLRLPEAQDGQLADDAYFDLIDWIRAQQADEAALVEAYANAIATDDLGVLGLAVKTAPTLRQSLQRIERYFRLVTDTAVYRLDETGDPVLWIFEGQTSHRAALELRNECALAAFARNMHRFVGDGLSLAYVTFQHPCRQEPERYAEYFGCPVRFGSAHNAIAMRPAMLESENRLGDPGLSDFMTKHLDKEFNSRDDDTSLSQAIVHRLTPALSNGAPQAAHVAQEMGMSERTLYRRLAEEGLTYRDVLGQAQVALARDLLRDGKASIAEIAFMTGFSEQSTFSRAFKRWVGQAPARFRQQATSD